MNGSRVLATGNAKNLVRPSKGLRNPLIMSKTLFDLSLEITKGPYRDARQAATDMLIPDVDEASWAFIRSDKPIVHFVHPFKSATHLISIISIVGGPMRYSK